VVVFLRHHHPIKLNIAGLVPLRPGHTRVFGLPVSIAIAFGLLPTDLSYARMDKEQTKT
jgi:hypothetical protein